MIGSLAAALRPTPAVDDRVMGSPILIAPPSVVTLVGMRPARATGRTTSFLVAASAPPRVMPGSVEMTPRTVAVLPSVARVILRGLLGSSETISPAASVASVVW